MNVLVTGGAGFIGSHLVRQLLAANHEVTVLDNVRTGTWQHLPAGKDTCTCWEMDIQDKAAREKIAQAGFDVIVHLAGQTMVDTSIMDPKFDAAENVMGTLNILEAARHSGVQRVIFASTAAAYGDVAEDRLPIREEEVVAPMSFYGLSKVTMERYLQLYHDLYGLDYVALRFANVYGERQGDKGEGGVISIFAKRIAQGQEITVFGDGKQTRDFIYAGDIATGIIAAMSTNKPNAVYNLSNQTETSLLELIALLGKATGKVVTPKFAAPREGDIRRSTLCNEAALANLVWHPQVDLGEGLARTIRYFQGR
ncbi:MAG: NAD-dependent epimerase/dehydratase family protein [Selenomonas sp.]|uniref:NAD-dependent epimerase/dehydratase family protein n=1 Tax=Selenomonas sp. TaxID=2053611 RepID=UPI0025CFE8B5|nr:NAD-dependent epimerase/dehydratase family protein [Selenomonas sp.]MCR5756905.1 NAD-dependent epimerase/dehydratase family protein [Selenomonas sp.]